MHTLKLVKEIYMVIYYCSKTKAANVVEDVKRPQSFVCYSTNWRTYVIVDLAIQFCHFQDACRNTTSSSIHCSTPEAVNSIAGTTVAACSTTASVASMAAAAAAAATKRKLLDDTELKSDVKKVCTYVVVKLNKQIVVKTF